MNGESSKNSLLSIHFLLAFLITQSDQCRLKYSGMIIIVYVKFKFSLIQYIK
jgi:hypothetical protein